MLLVLQALPPFKEESKPDGSSAAIDAQLRALWIEVSSPSEAEYHVCMVRAATDSLNEPSCLSLPAC